MPIITSCLWTTTIVSSLSALGSHNLQTPPDDLRADKTESKLKPSYTAAAISTMLPPRTIHLDLCPESQENSILHQMEQECLRAKSKRRQGKLALFAVCLAGRRAGRTYQLEPREDRKKNSTYALLFKANSTRKCLNAPKTAKPSAPPDFQRQISRRRSRQAASKSSTHRQASVTGRAPLPYAHVPWTRAARTTRSGCHLAPAVTSAGTSSITLILCPIYLQSAPYLRLHFATPNAGSAIARVRHIMLLSGKEIFTSSITRGPGDITSGLCDGASMFPRNFQQMDNGHERTICKQH
ncbi:hypothetical protein C8F01DRAFT_1238554 [Mycena amicta]|nr:hypothetical protein C8F01DRAFT_1238554 [Mycena amicta]